MAKKKDVENVVAPKKGATKKTAIAPEKKASPRKAVAKKEDATEVALKTDLVYAPKGKFEFNTNAPAVMAEVKRIVAKYKDIKITDANFDEAETLKRRVVTLRTFLTSRKKEAVKLFIAPVEEATKKTFDVLLKEVAVLEDVLASQLDVFEEARKDGLRVVLQGYVDEYQTRYELPEKFLALVEMKDKYFNKTQNEKDTIEDIESQFEEQLAAKKEEDSSKDLIRSEIGGDKRFNETLLFEQLDYRSVTAILTDIKTEKARFAEIDKGGSGDGLPKITVGAKVSSGGFFGSAKKKTRKTVLVQLTYDEDFGEAMKKFYEDNDVEVKFI